MKGRFEATKPSEHEYTLSVTMLLSEWIELKDQMTQKYISSTFKYLIGDMIRQAQKVYFPTSESSPESPDQT